MNQIPPLNDELKFILGRPNFATAGTAMRLRELGLYEIDHRAEKEQAAVIHWMLNLYLKHGDGWRDEAEKILVDHPASAGK